MSPQSALVVALVSGLVAALASAYLSYVVRLRAKRREDADERIRLAHVAFLALTDVVATNMYLKSYTERLLKAKGVSAEWRGYEASHAIAALTSNKMPDLSADDRAVLNWTLRPVFSSLTAGVDRIEISPSDLGRMNEVTIYTYHRFEGAREQLRAGLKVLESFLAADTWNVEAGTALIHGLFRAYSAEAEASGLLRAALGTMAGLSSDYSYKCLVRSYQEAHRQVLKGLEHSEKLKLAKKAAEETGAEPVPQTTSA